MGYSRDTFYRYHEAVQSGGVEALFDENRRKPNLKNRIDESTAERVRAYAVEQPACGQVRARYELRKVKSRLPIPGYLGSQDTFYVGTIMGVGRIYQQAFVDT